MNNRFKQPVLFIIFIFISVILVKCGSSQNKLIQGRESTDKEWVPPPRKEMRLAPGTAKVRAEIIKTVHTDTLNPAFIRIHQVLRYGPATPPLSIGTELSAEMTKSLMENIETTDKYHWIQGDTIIITLKYRQHVISEKSHPVWRIIHIHE